jgi:hypothetical protein
MPEAIMLEVKIGTRRRRNRRRRSLSDFVN